MLHFAHVLGRCALRTADHHEYNHWTTMDLVTIQLFAAVPIELLLVSVLLSRLSDGQLNLSDNQVNKLQAIFDKL
jgi:hypothetical protein